MPFIDLETHTKRNQSPMATIIYAIKTRKTGSVRNDKKPTLTISIPSVICGTSKAERFKLQLGNGKEAGKLRIVGASSEIAGVEPSQHAHFFRWNFGFVPLLGEDEFEGERRPVRKISDDEFEIDVPVSWFES
jgi:hypothetical protein